MAILYRFAENQNDRLPELAADLVRRQVAVIATLANGALAAKATTTTTPIVFLLAEDPVRVGLVSSLARPGGNLTGINFFSAELLAKRLGSCVSWYLQPPRVVVLVNPTGPNSETTLRDAQATARATRLEIEVLNASTSREINAAFAAFARERPDALFVDIDPFFTSRRVPIDQSGVAPCHSHHVSGAPIYRGWRAIKLTLPAVGRAPRTPYRSHGRCWLSTLG